VQNTCAVTTDNRGFCWGQDAFGQVGDGGVISNNTVDKRTQPLQVVGGAIWSMIAPGGNSTCGVTTVGEVRCWGSAGTGILGNGTIIPTSSPSAPVSGGHTFTSVDVSTLNYACALTTTNQAYCWGANLSGQLGAALPPDVASNPVLGGGSLTFSELSVSLTAAFSCGISVNRLTTSCWGDNAAGQMGNGTTSAARNPTPGVVLGQTPQ
jgi:alpha-tubulin suppressor-like RCC1 family protein